MKFKSSGTVGRLKNRFFIIVICFIAIFAAVAGKLIFIQVSEGNSASQTTYSRSVSSSIIEAKRGDIVDANNVLLASSTVVYALQLSPKDMLTEGHNYLEITAQLIEKCFGFSAEEVKRLVNENKDSQYLPLLDNLTYSQSRDFIEMLDADSKTIKEFLGLPEDYKLAVEVGGAVLIKSYTRNYPYGTLASSVLGFMLNDSGAYGLEKQYNAVLSGTDGKKYEYVDSDNIVESVYIDAQDGASLQLTIDYNIQSIVEKYMTQMLEETGAKTIAVTIQDPNTGAFLAMADTDTFDANNPNDLTAFYSDEELAEMTDSQVLEARTGRWNNYCVSETFEPGSTFKAFTVAGALESGAITKDDWYYCDGSVSVLDYTIHCANIAGHGDISLTGALAESCNMALMDIATAEGVDTFVKYQGQFGFGEYTGIDLPNEVSCSNLMFTRENMTDLDLKTNSFGQNFNVTMVQMSSAFCSLVNGGTYYKPYVVKGIYNSDNELIKSIDKEIVSKPVSKDTADYIKEALRHVVTEGTGTDAAVPGYITAGKTGTAEKGIRDNDQWIASFIGFAPYDNPVAVCYVVIDEPEAGGDGSSVYACQLYSQIMSEVLPYLNATTASEDYDPTGVGSPEPETTSEESEAAQNADEDYNDADTLAGDYNDAEEYYEEDYDDSYYYDDYYEDYYYEEQY